MKVIIQRDALLKPLQMMSGVVERRQTMPILSNVHLSVEENKLSLTATDLEIELKGHAAVEDIIQPGSITVSAKKLLDICRALPEESKIELSLENDHTLLLRSGKSRFLLTTLPGEDFPRIEEAVFMTEFSINQAKLKKLIGKIHFAMGQQDVRHYLNGVLFEINQSTIKCVATDGHRLAFSSLNDVEHQGPLTKIIIPRKSILELMRLLDSQNEDVVKMSLGDNHFQAASGAFIFTSKLINAQYPDYHKLIPRSVEYTALASREDLKYALTRASILSNEKFKGVRCHLDLNSLKIVANNPEQEEAEEQIQLEYEGIPLEMGFNVSYLLDVVSTIASEKIRWSFTDPNGGVLMDSVDKDDNLSSLYVVMPMRL